MIESIVAVVTLIVTGSCWLAYQHPDAYRRLAKTVGKSLGWVAGLWIIFQIAGECYLDLGEQAVGKEITKKIKDAVTARLDHPGNVLFLTLIGVFAYGCFLWSFVGDLKKSPLEIKPGPSDQKGLPRDN
jgi:hypothetical protein